MTLPFSKAEFLGVFVDYNAAIWPLQLAAGLFGLVAVIILFRRPAGGDRAIAAILALFWLVTGVGYHWLFFTRANPAAWLFGAAFVVAAAVFIVEGLLRNRIRFSTGTGARTIIAGALAVYALLVYPLWGLAVTHPYPATPLFGVTPCPTTIFTIGMLLLATHPAPWILAAVPFLWSIVGGTAAVLLDVPADWALIVAAGIWLLVKPGGRIHAET